MGPVRSARLARATRRRIALCAPALALYVTCSAAPLASAQELDAEFCAMRRALGEQGETRVGDVSSGTVRASPVVIRREVEADTYYVLTVALSRPPTEASVGPAARVGDELPAREGTRIAHDFLARSAGEVELTFSAPAATRYHAALYRVPPARENQLTVRPRGRALMAGGGGAWNDRPPAAVPPDCRGAEPFGLGGPPRSVRVTIGRPTVRGALSARAVTSVVRADLGELQLCANAARAGRAPTFALRLVVSATGAVASASSDDREAPASCILAAARRWRFPPLRGGGVATVELELGLDGL